jgi:dihydrodipicolinate synthase/N-acetylneuraminate lyase
VVREEGKTVDKALACFKHAMVIDGVITSDYVANGTPTLSEDEKRKLSDAYQRLKMEIEETCPANWVSRKTI